MRKFFFIISLLMVSSTFSAAQLRFNYAPYSIKALQSYPFKASAITLHSVIEDTPEFITYRSSYTTMQRTMYLYFGVPKLEVGQVPKRMVIMLRDFELHSHYSTGKAVAEVARQYLQAGFAVVAPDFFGFAQSDEPPIGTANSAEALLLMPINAAELYLSLASSPNIISDTIARHQQPILPNRFSQIALWGQGDGGLAALYTLSILQEPIPTILWTPASHNFAQAWVFSRERYSLIAGRNAQKFLTDFEHSYDLHHYSVIYNLSSIAPTTPIILHHAEHDKRVPASWIHELNSHIHTENMQRQAQNIAPIYLTFTLHPYANLSAHTSTIILNDIAWLRRVA